MIVPMKKIFLVVLDAEKKAALKKLRSAGLVHLENVQGVGAELNSLKGEYSKLESAYMQLSDLKVPKGFSSKEKIQAADSYELADKILELFDAKKACLSEISQCSIEMERLQKWGGVNPDDFKFLADKHITLAMYEIPTAKYRILPDDVKTVFVNEDKSNIRFLLLTENGEKPASLPAEAFAVTMPQKSTDEMAEIILRNKAEIARIDNLLLSSVSSIPEMKKAAAVQAKKVEFENVFSGMEHDSESNTPLAWISGFVPSSDVDKVKKLADSEKWGFASTDPSEDDMVPTKLKNNKLVSLIYPVTDFLGTVPGYNEYDISGWFLLFFAIFFGIIFGDGGYGALMTLIAVFALIGSTAKKKKASPSIMLLMLLGITTMAWGTITCTWFGIDVQYLPEWLKNISVPAISNVTSAISEEKSTWVSQNLQILCFTLALVQLTIAHLKGFVRYIRSLKCIGEIGSLGMLWGLYTLVLNMVVDADRFPLPSFAIPLIGGGFLLNFVFANYEGNLGKSILESLKNIVSVLLGVVNVFSDIVSYIRLWAVGLAGSAISATVNEMAGPMLGGFIIFAGVLLLCFGHGLNMVLNVLSVIVHGVRLNTLEFSNHLGMSWSGFKYEPFCETVEK
ncbi:MAG: ATPase [Treponemataceae bacterium]|nr:ATPase [Treponemataceae bacterium]